MSKDIKAVTQTDLRAEGIVSQILSLEEQGKELVDKGKAIMAEADGLRELLKTTMQTANLVNIKHSSGYQVSLKTRSTFKSDPDTLLKEVKSKRLTAFIEKIPAHEEVNQAEFIKYFKSSAWKPEDFGLEVKETQFIEIKKPRVE